MPDLFEPQPVAISAAAAPAPRFVDVALERGIDSFSAGLTYAIPPNLSTLTIGDRVLVPLGRSNKPVPGYVIRLSDHSDYPKIKKILQRDDQAISLTPDLIELALWMTAYYCCPLGMVLASMLPAAVKHGTGRKNLTLVALAPEFITPQTPPDPASPSPSPKGKKLSKLQQSVLTAATRLAQQGQIWLPIKDLADLAGARSIAPVQQLLQKNILIARHESIVHAASLLGAEPAQNQTHPSTDNPAPNSTPLTLNPAQQQTLDQLIASVDQGFGVFLLHGVTGSGKTEVYLRAIEHILVRSQTSPTSDQPPPPPGIIVLVPEIALTPQAVARFTQRLSTAGVAVLHSGLTSAQRHQQWQRIRTGQARIAVGARSAVFAPFPWSATASFKPGIIIVDEEHDHSYKQDQLPRYHARDVAIKRAQILGIPVLLGSATPSLESYYNAVGIKDAQSSSAPIPQRPKYKLLTLPDRAGELTFPTVHVVDMREERRKRYIYTGSKSLHLLSLRLEHELTRTLQARGQAILLVNRRGYANYIACPDHRCGWQLRCSFCDAAMIYHKDRSLPLAGFVRCHHCQAEQVLPPLCPLCGKKTNVFGLGTQRVEEELQKKFPNAKLLRMDSDSMRSARDYHHSLAQFGAGQVDVLLGTQMIAKGLDFPNVRLVGVISADTALHVPDFRASERTFQLVAQVAGRAGRGRHPGLVIVQTFSPNEPAIQLAANHNYVTFADAELRLRQQVQLPPVTRMARIIVRDKKQPVCQAQAAKLFDHLSRFNQESQPTVRILGPAPCPISRIAGFHRYQIELFAPDAATLQKLLTALRNARLLHADSQTAIDVDPVSLL